MISIQGHPTEQGETEVNEWAMSPNQRVSFRGHQTDGQEVDGLGNTSRKAVRLKDRRVWVPEGTTNCVTTIVQC